jgi:hypothetical protein
MWTYPYSLSFLHFQRRTKIRSITGQVNTTFIVNKQSLLCFWLKKQQNNLTFYCVTKLKRKRNEKFSTGHV